jgi:acetyltransferase-like isoleucine patch superfamily enzyme
VLRDWFCGRVFGRFGEGSEIRVGAYVVYPQRVFLGKGVIIRPGTMIFAETGRVEIGDGVLMGAGVHVYVNSHRHDRADIPICEQGDTDGLVTRLEAGCWVGACSVILAGRTVGRNSVVGAGSVVTRDVPCGEVWGGNPARVIRMRLSLVDSAAALSSGRY